MSDLDMIEAKRLLYLTPMSDSALRSAPPSLVEVHAKLERAHHEICTALTVLRSNVDLVRVELRGGPSDRNVSVHRHLSELDLAVERLRRIAHEMRGWQPDGSHEPRTESDARQEGSLLP